MPQLKFPDGFLWGAATSSHQVEGNNHNDWSEWEQSHAEILAKEAEYRRRKQISHLGTYRGPLHLPPEAFQKENYISGTACDHWNRYAEDFDILKSLNLNAYRFSIEWSRIEPTEGVFDEAALRHYRDMIAALRERGIEPIVTLWHWTLPLWLSQKGGLTYRDFPHLFERYTKKVVEALGDQVSLWVTLNEFEVCASHGYLMGWWPPEHKSLLSFFRAIRNLIRAHRRSYAAIKALFPAVQVGIAKHQIPFVVLRPTPWNLLLKNIADSLWNHWFLKRIQHQQDFIGLNCYRRNVIGSWFSQNPNATLTDFGWEFWPESLYLALKDLQRYQKPIYITENGLADASDHLRHEFIERSLTAVHQAIAEGVDVRGYLHWSLLDNFEWDKGYWPRFGLIAVNRETQERTVRKSALAYAETCRNNALETAN